MKWQEKLTDDELLHVKEWCGGTLQSFINNREAQWGIKEERDALHPEMDNEPCWVCRGIAEKLGIVK